MAKNSVAGTRLPAVAVDRISAGAGMVHVSRGFAGMRALLGCPDQEPWLSVPMPGAALLCLSTCPDAETAARVAHALVAERLAACVNRLPGVMSTYRWEGRIHDDAEVLLVIKTTREGFDALRERLVELHPYEVPEFIALDIADGLPAYLDWLHAETSP